MNNTDKNPEFVKQLNVKDISFSVLKKTMQNLIKKISINVFGYEDKTLEIMQKELHYVSVKDLNRFMTNEIKYHGKNHSC